MWYIFGLFLDTIWYICCKNSWQHWLTSLRAHSSTTGLHNIGLVKAFLAACESFLNCKKLLQTLDLEEVIVVPEFVTHYNEISTS